jgi:anti-sigma factor RsiW
MECETVRELLGNYIDEDLTDTLRRAVDKHVANCTTCLVDLTTLRHAVDSLKESQEIEQASPWFAERLLHRLAQETGASPTGIETPVKDLQLGLW